MEAGVLTLTPGAGPPIGAGLELEGMFYYDDGTGGLPKGLYYCEQDEGGWVLLNSSVWTTATNETDIYYDTGNIGIGTSSPDTSAALEIDSTTAGFLPPRMNVTEMNAISSPASGLMIFDTTASQWMGYDGTEWTALAAPAGAGVGGISGAIIETRNVCPTTTRMTDPGNMTDIPGVVTQITTQADSRLLIDWDLKLEPQYSNKTVYLQCLVDDVVVASTSRFFDAAAFSNMSGHIEIGPLSATTHTIKMQAKSSTSSTDIIFEPQSSSMVISEQLIE